MNGHDPEGMRRNISRWLTPTDSAVTPSRASRAAVAVALGLDPNHFEDEDDEESELVLALVAAMRAVARQEIRKAQEAALT